MSPVTVKLGLAQKGEHTVYRSIFLERVPHIFSSATEYDAWRREIAEPAELKPAQIKIFGSAHVGFSLAPAKFGRPFSREAMTDRPPSDLDLVLIDDGLFTDAWNAVLQQDRGAGLRMNPDDRQKLHQDTYYGFLADKVIPKRSKVFTRILSVRGLSGRHEVSSGLSVNIRLYRREDDLFGYAIASLRQLKLSLQGHPNESRSQ
jgi:hypothetical protein